MSRIYLTILSLAICFLLPPAAFSSEPVRPKTRAQNFIEENIAEEPLRSGLVGVLAVKMNGDTIAESGSLRKLLPASNTKLITTGLALRSLGPDYRFATTIAYSGHVSGGTLHGDLYILGGGDPTIASGDPGTPPADTLFSQWKAMMDKAGIRRVDGCVIGDGRHFDGPIEKDSWSYSDLGTYYGAGCDGLSFNRNILYVNVSAAPAVGLPVNASVSYPVLPWMEFRMDCVTAPAGTGDNLYLYNTDLAPVCELRGTFAVDRTPKREECSYKFGALACATYFTDYLRCSGLDVTGGAADVDSRGMVRTAESLMKKAWPSDRQEKAADGVVADGSCEGGLRPIGTTYSPAVASIARTTNSRSDNFYAETLLRELSLLRTGSASYDSCAVTVLRELDSLGTDSSYGIRMVDGSGLARHNYISPDFFCRFLASMYNDDAFLSFLQSVSRPGEPGMRSCLAGSPASVKSRIHMKSGSMNGVLCYSGYILPSSGDRDGTIVFSIMTNNCTGPVQKIRDFVYEFILLAAGEN